MSKGKIIIVHDSQQNTLSVQLHQMGSFQSAPPVPFVDTLEPSDRSDLRWYLEDYLHFPIGIYPDRARRIEAKLTEWGGSIFSRLFGSGKGRDFYVLIKNIGLKNYGFEIHYESSVARNFPWELLYDTDSKFYLVHQFASFTRFQESSAAWLVTPRISSEQLRILLIIARPYGRRDVPYRTVARPIMELLQQPLLRNRIHVEVLRPPTFEHFVKAVSRTRDDGSPMFDVVHFDGHGGFGYDLMTNDQIDVFDLFRGPHGKLLFETEDGNEHAVAADKLREVLGQHHVPLIVINACRSGMESLEDPRIQSLLQSITATQDNSSPEEIRKRLMEQNQEIASVASTLVDAGAHGVVGMGYVIYARSAAIFMRGFYERLLLGGTAAEAVNAGRLALVENAKRPTRFGEIELQDWIVPVYNERAPVQLFTPPDPHANIELLLEEMLSREKISSPLKDALPASPQFGFLGRDVELLNIERALIRKNVVGVTLIGLAGMGKTTLAVACSRWLMSTHTQQVAGGVFFHAFIDTSRSGQVHRPNLALLIRMVGCQKLGDDFLRLSDTQQLTLVIRLLQENPCLLILDNVEAASGLGEQPALLNARELEEFCKFLQRVTPPNGMSRILVTSRREELWLGLHTEMLEIGGLDEEASSQLAVAVLRYRMDAESLQRKLADETWQKDYNALLTTLNGHPLAL